MFAINFFRCFGPHQDHWPTKQALNWHPINNLLFIIFAWINCETKLRRINFVYDAVARKMGNHALSGLGLYLQSLMAKPDRNRRHQRSTSENALGTGFRFCQSKFVIAHAWISIKRAKLCSYKRKFRIFVFGDSKP
jgi:hypothetical protein